MPSHLTIDIMHAIEFQARIRNGIIEVPDDIKDQLPAQAWVIILSEETRQLHDVDLIEQLLKHPRVVSEFTPLTREQIHSRN